jgi:predicted MFS family arabinose efflux permease
VRSAAFCSRAIELAPMINQSVATQERVVLLPLIATSFFQVLDMMVVNPLGAWIVPELALGTAQFGLLLLAYNLVSAMVGVLCAPLLDRFDRRHVLFTSCFALAAVTLLTSRADGLADIVVLRGLAGACGGLVASQTLAAVGDLVSPARRGQAIGFVMGAFGIASVAGVPLSLAVASQFGWRASFVAVGVTGLLVSMFTLALPSVRPSGGTITLRDRWAACRSNGAALVASACLAASAFVIIPFIGLFYVSHVGVRATELGLVYVVGGGTAAIFMARLGVWVDRFGPARCYYWIAGLSVLPIAVLTSLGDQGLWAAMAASTLLFCFMTGRNLPLNAVLVGSVPPVLRGSFMSVNMAGQSLATALGAVVGGFVSSMGGAVTGTFQINGMISIALTVVAIGAVLTLRRQRRPT